MKNVWRISLIGSFLVIIDQFSKGIVQSILQVTETKIILKNLMEVIYLEKDLYLFSLLSKQNGSLRWAIYLILSFAILIIFSILIAKSRHQVLLCSSYGLIFSGFIGNLIDLYSYDKVIEVFKFYYLKNSFVIFNIADLIISIGLLMLISIKLKRKLKRGVKA